MRKLNLSLLLLFIISVGLHAYEPQILQKNPRSLGMGGVGVSTYGYSFSPLANPAALGLMHDYTLIPILDLGVAFNQNSFDLAKEAVDFASGKKTVRSINYDYFLGKLSAVGINGPLSLGYMGKGFGVWLNSGAGVQAGLFFDQDNPIKGVKFNTLFSTMDSISDIASGGNLSAGNATAVKDILVGGIYKDLISSGLSEQDAYRQANKLLAESTGSDPSIIYIDENGNPNINNINIAIQNIKDGDGNLKIPEEALKGLLPKLAFKAYMDVAVNVGYGYKIAFQQMDNVSGISLGATVRFVQRFKSDVLNNQDVVVVAQGDALQKSLWQAFSITSDFGVSLRLQNFVLAFAARDAFSSPFQWRSIDGTESHIATSFLPSLDLGMSYRFLFNNVWAQEIGLYLEMVDLLDKTMSFDYKIRAGLEVKLFRFLDLRLGVYDRFVTAGFGMGGKWGRVDFSYYRETVALFPGLYVSGNQFAVGFSIGLENTPERKRAKLARLEQEEKFADEFQYSEEAFRTEYETEDDGQEFVSL